MSSVSNLQAIVNLLSYGKKDLMLYKKYHYITPNKENCYFLNTCFFFYQDRRVSSRKFVLEDGGIVGKIGGCFKKEGFILVFVSHRKDLVLLNLTSRRMTSTSE